MRAQVSVLLAALAQASCRAPCEPDLDLLKTDGKAPNAGELSDGDTVLVQYAIPEGVNVDENIHFRIETPCTCVTFQRPAPEAGTSGEGGGALAKDNCGANTTTIPLVVPKGGECRMQISVTFANDSQEKTYDSGEAAAVVGGAGAGRAADGGAGGGTARSKCALKCTSDVKCVDGLPSDTSATTTGGGGGSG